MKALSTVFWFLQFFCLTLCVLLLHITIATCCGALNMPVIVHQPGQRFWSQFHMLLESSFVLFWQSFSRRKPDNASQVYLSPP